MAERYNEGKAIDAVLRHIEVREASPRLHDGRSPDDQQDPDERRRVDYVCTVGKQLYAFEHTGIQPFENQIAMQAHNENLFAPVMTHFQDRVPVGEYWELSTPVEASLGLSGASINQLQTGLISWIQANAATLPVNRFGDRHPYPARNQTAPGVPFGFALYRWSVLPQWALSGVFWRHEIFSGDLEAARRTRLARMCEAKFDKLGKWKRDEGARSVLVMEDDDQFVTNHVVVAEAMAEVEAGRQDAPDEVFLVSTFRPTPWWVICLRSQGKGYLEDDNERVNEFDPALLTRLTKR